MSKLPNLYSEGAHTTMTEILGESLNEDDYTKLKRENEHYQQELHALRLKLNTSETVTEELRMINETLEQSVEHHRTMINKILNEKKEMYRVEKQEFINYIAELETKNAQNMQEITDLHEELKKYKELKKEEHLSSFVSPDNIVTTYKEKNKELDTLLKNEKKMNKQLEEKLATMEIQWQDYKNLSKITADQLAEKNEMLENIWGELASNRMELESLKVTPASDTRKGNSLFAEVEDRRQILLNQMEELQSKYKEVKQQLNKKTKQIELLTAEKTSLIGMCETDIVNIAQENVDLLKIYKSRIVELQNNLQLQMKKNYEVEKILDQKNAEVNFSYAQSLVAKKKEELKVLNEKMEDQIMKMLMQEEKNNDISKQLHHWRYKAMLMKVTILAIKAKLVETEQSNHINKSILEIIENCNAAVNNDIEKSCDDLKIISNISNNITLVNDVCQQSLRISKEPTVCVNDDGINNHKELSKKIVHFTADTKDTESKPLKKESKQLDYPILVINDSHVD